MKKCIVVHGLGSIGMRHARNLIRLGHDVVGYDPDMDRVEMLRATGGRLDWPQQIDGVVIATPTKIHKQSLDTYQSITDPSSLS